jgi:hypothetical protein
MHDLKLAKQHKLSQKEQEARLRNAICTCCKPYINKEDDRYGRKIDGNNKKTAICCSSDYECILSEDNCSEISIPPSNDEGWQATNRCTVWAAYHDKLRPTPTTRSIGPASYVNPSQLEDKEDDTKEPERNPPNAHMRQHCPVP